MNYKITHTTNYRYSTPVSVCHNMVVLTPRPTDYLTVSSHRLSIRPIPISTEKRRDTFGNLLTRFSLEEHHSKLTITATSRVSVLPRDLPAAEATPTCDVVRAGIADASDPNWLAVVPFVFDSPRIQRSSVFADFAAPVVQGSRSVLTALTDLTRLIYTEFKYDKNATRVDTPTESAFENRHGVCQDFAHIAVACLRSLKMPARYVSGYLRTIPPPGKERLVGADQSHAWVSVWCGPGLRWVDFDPTNNCVCGTDHVPIAVGRDYSDVVPIKGVFLGGGEPELTVSVDVAPEERPAESFSKDDA
ncbi:MAG: transglutaminase family protein [Fuerstiella sp.]